MDEIELAIHAAWSRIAPTLAADPRALQLRLARREKLALLTHPPRAWCLAIRASDVRLPSYRGTGGPPVSSGAQESRASRPCHEDSITLTRRDVVKLCSPVELTPPGEPILSVARKLGVSRTGLLHARVNNVFTEHRVRARGGRWSPILYSPHPLDPASKNFASPDPLWSFTASYLPNRLPSDFEPVTLWRVPACTHAALSEPSTLGESNGRNVVDIESLHPEHPQRDRTESRQRKSLALRPRVESQDDYVWYKRDPQTGAYLGYDRKNKHAAAHHRKHQRELELANEAARKSRRESKTPSNVEGHLMKGSLVFRGWQWICPKCEKRVNVLYMPVGRELLVAGCELRVKDEDAASLSQLATSNSQPATVPSAPATSNSQPATVPSALATSNSQLATPPSFACAKCTRVKRFSFTNPANAWNEIITYLTGGLLYGREVKPPAGWREQISKTGRKTAYFPKLHREPSTRRAQIEKLLLNGKTINEVAAELGLKKGTVLFYTTEIYRQHGVRCLKELLIKHNKPTRPGMRGPATGPRGAGPAPRPKRANAPATGKVRATELSAANGAVVGRAVVRP